MLEKSKVRRSPYWPTVDVDVESGLLIVRWTAQVNATALEYYIKNRGTWQKHCTDTCDTEYRHPLNIKEMGILARLLSRQGTYMMSLNFTKRAREYMESAS